MRCSTCGTASSVATSAGTVKESPGFSSRGGPRSSSVLMKDNRKMAGSTPRREDCQHVNRERQRNRVFEVTPPDRRRAETFERHFHKFQLLDGLTLERHGNPASNLVGDREHRRGHALAQDFPPSALAPVDVVRHRDADDHRRQTHTQNQLIEVHSSWTISVRPEGIDGARSGTDRRPTPLEGGSVRTPRRRPGLEVAPGRSEWRAECADEKGGPGRAHGRRPTASTRRRSWMRTGRTPRAPTSHGLGSPS